ncbi:MAG: hypothetical protein JRC86_10800 [Deltaproteobacteria bacterium]|nr:hypothetical protein [Deltaproteobacteria bacterium]
MTIRERIATMFAPNSYGIKDGTGAMFFLEARRVRVDRAGRLIFSSLAGYVVAIVDADKWERVLKGVTLEDFEK